MSKDTITAVPSFRDTFDSLTDTRILSGLPSNAPGNKLYVNGLFGRTDPALRRIVNTLNPDLDRKNPDVSTDGFDSQYLDATSKTVAGLPEETFRSYLDEPTTSLKGLLDSTLVVKNMRRPLESQEVTDHRAALRAERVELEVLRLEIVTQVQEQADTDQLELQRKASIEALKASQLSERAAKVGTPSLLARLGKGIGKTVGVAAIATAITPVVAPTLGISR